jgi:hypothetical protein
MFDVAARLQVANRTGEDALAVELSVGPDACVIGASVIGAVPDNETAVFHIGPSDIQRFGTFNPTPIRITWTRRSTGRRYEQTQGNLEAVSSVGGDAARVGDALSVRPSVRPVRSPITLLCKDHWPLAKLCPNAQHECSHPDHNRRNGH